MFRNGKDVDGNSRDGIRSTIFDMDLEKSPFSDLCWLFAVSACSPWRDERMVKSPEVRIHSYESDS